MTFNELTPSFGRLAAPRRHSPSVVQDDPLKLSVRVVRFPDPFKKGGWLSKALPLACSEADQQPARVARLYSAAGISSEPHTGQLYVKPKALWALCIPAGEVYTVAMESLVLPRRNYATGILTPPRPLPVDEALRRLRRLWTGVRVKDLSPEVRRALGLDRLDGEFTSSAVICPVT
jgi:hypothetical protein